MSQLEQYAALYSMLHNMEKDLGLTNLTAAEKAVLSAVTQLQGALSDTEFVSSRAIKNHDLCAHLPNPTFFARWRVCWSGGIFIFPMGARKGFIGCDNKGHAPRLAPLEAH